MTINYYGNIIDIKFDANDSSGAAIHSKNPNVLHHLFDNTKEQRFTFIITKFGQIPDPHYFNKAFDPILVVGDDGKEYNVIPSDQFK